MFQPLHYPTMAYGYLLNCKKENKFVLHQPHSLSTNAVLLTHRYFIINKPRNMVSQFISPCNVRLLGHLNFAFPAGTHAIGRLDSDSEGLLILTTNKKVTRLLFRGEQPHKRTYLVQVNNTLSSQALERLRTGVNIPTGPAMHYTTPPCEVCLINDPQAVYPFSVQEEWGSHTWLLITLTEGKHRQVRKMMMAVKHRCRRLIRVSIEDLMLEGLPPGGVMEIPETVFFKKLHIAWPF